MSLSVASRAFFPDPANHVPTVLVVEDEILIRVTIAAYLQEAGFKVLEAGTVNEAIQILDINLTPVDLVFSDVVMPGEDDGFALAQWVHENHPGLPVVMTSGDLERCRAARTAMNGDPFFAKPYDIAAVTSKIRRLVCRSDETH